MAVLYEEIQDTVTWVQVFFGYVWWFFLGIFYGFLGLDGREPVRVSQRGLIWVFSGYFFFGFLGNLHK